MTLFRDISGWREELNELQKGSAYKNMYPKSIRNPQFDPLVPKSTVLDFVETLLAHEETRKALLDLNRWHKANPPETNPDPENDRTFPHKAANLQSDFSHWFMLKTGFGPRIGPYIHALNLTVLILNGDIPDARSAEADDYLHRTAKTEIDFDC